MANVVKTGVATVCVLVIHACRVVDKFGPSFTAAVNASTLTSEEKATILATTAAITASCEVFRKLSGLR